LSLSLKKIGISFLFIVRIIFVPSLPYGMPAKIPYLLKICTALYFLKNAFALNTKDI